MKIHVKLFARARDLAGTGTLELELPESCTVREFRSALISEYPALAPLGQHLLISVGTDYASEETLLDGTQEVACFPPVSGG